MIDASFFWEPAYNSFSHSVPYVWFFSILLSFLSEIKDQVTWVQKRPYDWFGVLVVMSGESPLNPVEVRIGSTWRKVVSRSSVFIFKVWKLGGYVTLWKIKKNFALGIIENPWSPQTVLAYSYLVRLNYPGLRINMY